MSSSIDLYLSLARYPFTVGRPGGLGGGGGRQRKKNESAHGETRAHPWIKSPRRTQTIWPPDPVPHMCTHIYMHVTYIHTYITYIHT